MSFKRYVIGYVIFSAVMGIIYFLVFLNEELYKAWDLVVYAYLGFTLLSLITFVISKLLHSADNQSELLELTFSNMLLKLIFTAVIVFIYYSHKNPETGLFIIPFIITYIGFTIFEIYHINSETK